MPEPLRRPSDPPLSPRDKLRAAIDALNEEQERVNALSTGQEEAQRNMWTARDQLTSAKTGLDSARRTDKQSLAYDFVMGKPRSTVDVSAAEALVEAANRAIGHWEDIEAACASELSGAEKRISRRRHEVNEAIADFLIASPEFAAFLDGLDRAWATLRSYSIIGEDLIGAGKGYVPASVMSRLRRSEPLLERVGYAVDGDFIEQWRRAFAELAAGNSDVRLPKRTSFELVFCTCRKR